MVQELEYPTEEVEEDETLEEIYFDFDEDILEYSESDFLFKHTRRRINKKLGMIILVSGETGRGKSYYGLRFLERWYRERFKENFPLNHICNQLDEAVTLVRNFKRKGEGIMVEELSAHAGSRASMTTQNKMWNTFLDICRVKQAVIIGNCPHISFVDKHYQMMCQAWVNCYRIDFKKKIVLAKAYWLQTSPFKSEPYKHRYLNEDGDDIDMCYMKKPADELCVKYEEMKGSSNDDIFETIVLKMQYDRAQKLKTMGQREIPNRTKKSYQLHIEGYSDEEGAKKMKIKKASFQENVRRAKKMFSLINRKKSIDKFEKDYINTQQETRPRG